MAAKVIVVSSSALSIHSTLSTKLFSPSLPTKLFSHSYPPCSERRANHFKVSANLGGGGGEAGGEVKKGGKKKFITKEEEPEQYWQTAGEREGENPMKTPLPYIIIFGMSTPFVILAIAFANGWIKVPVR
nr:uncharacterized protein LOC109158672 [Ipomoea batatas]